MSSPQDVDISQFSQYWPYTKEQWGKIEELWRTYKEDIGLEGDLYLELKKRNLSPADIGTEIKRHNNGDEIKHNLTAWNDLRGEIEK